MEVETGLIISAVVTILTYPIVITKVLKSHEYSRRSTDKYVILLLSLFYSMVMWVSVAALFLWWESTIPLFAFIITLIGMFVIIESRSK